MASVDDLDKELSRVEHTEGQRSPRGRDVRSGQQGMDVRSGQQSMAMPYHYVNHKASYMGSMMVVGLMNNLGYCLVGSSAQRLSNKFGMDSFMAVFQLVLIAFSFLARVVNSVFFIRIAHRNRILVILLISAMSFLVLASANLINQSWGFYLAIVASALTGMGSSIGESTILGFLGTFPSLLVSGWGAGTGLAGVFSNLLYLATSSQNINDCWLFFPLTLISTGSYWAAFSWVDRQQYRFLFKTESIQPNDHPSQQSIDPFNQYISLINDEPNQVQNEAQNNANLTWTNVSRLPSIIFWYAANMGMVYYFEYCILTCFFDRSNPLKENEKSNNFLQRNAYVVLGLTYQIGVLMSRSSLALLKIPRVEIMTGCQLINFVVYLLNSKYHFMDIYVQIGVSLWVGLMGGASYVNVTHNIINDPMILPSQKELAMNICTFTNDLLILSAAVTSLVLSNTYLS